MKTFDVAQDSPEWHQLRATHYRTASRAAAALGKSKYQSRNELLLELSTGIQEDNSDKSHLFASGHRAEASARPIAEEIIGDELYPATGLSDDDYLLASLDGVTMMEDVCWEHKLINNDLRRATVETLDEHYKIQMDQQMAVTGAEKCLFMASDGTKKDCNWFWYPRDENRINALIAGWQQFDSDLEAFTPPESRPEAVAKPVAEFPALFIDLTGDVQGTNLVTYKQAVVARIQSINTDLQTDQDFADAEETVKFLDKAEKEIDSVKKQALAKTASIDELFRTIDHLREEMRNKRLELNKLVTERKKEVKVEIAQRARQQVDQHIATLNEGLMPVALPQIVTDFNGAMKGKRTVATLQGAADDEVARAKIEASAVAEKIRKNLSTLQAAGNSHLFQDLQQLVFKETDDLKAVISSRIAEAKAAEEQRMEAERERIRQEEQAKAQQAARESQQPAEPEKQVLQGDLQPAEKNSAQPSRASVSAMQPNQTRPTDEEIVEVLALHYRVHESKVLGWLVGMDLDAYSEKLASNF